MYGTLKYVDGVERAAGIYSRDHWALEAEPHVMMRIKRIFPRVQASRYGAVLIAATEEVARDIEWIIDRWPLEMDDMARSKLRKASRAHRKIEEVRSFILAGGELEGDWRVPAREARHYQLTAADLISNQKRILITDALGLGKSMTGLLTLRDPQALPALVVTMTHLPPQWVRELEKTWPDLKHHIVKKGQFYDLNEVCDGSSPDVIVMSYSKLAGWSDHLAGQVRTVIFDEAQELRTGESTAKGAAAGRLADNAIYVVGLSASPIYNHGNEIFNVVNILKREALGTRDEFAREWGLSYDGKQVTNPAALGTYLRDQGLMLGRTRKEVGRELGSEPLRITHTVEADEHVLHNIAGDAVEMARLLLSKSTPGKDRWQLAGDFDWRMRQATGIAKAPFVAEFVRMLLQSEERVVLFGWHRAVYELWAERLREFHPVFYTGEESPAKKEEAAKAFMEGRSRILIMSLRSGAGLDGLQEASHVAVFGELDWSPQVHSQCIGRLYRDGQEEPVIAYFLVSDHGADPVMAEVLSLKTQQSELIVHPDAEMLTPIVDSTERMRRLAADVLARNGVELPPAEEPESPAA